MRRVMDGETVYVAVRADGGRDRLNNEVRAWAEPVAVDHVLVSESTEDDQAFTRPDGITSVYTMGFRYDCDLEMRGAKVTVRGRELLVAGSPTHGPRLQVNPYNMTVRAGVQDG